MQAHKKCRIILALKFPLKLRISCSQVPLWLESCLVQVKITKDKNKEKTPTKKLNINCTVEFKNKSLNIFNYNLLIKENECGQSKPLPTAPKSQKHFESLESDTENIICRCTWDTQVPWEPYYLILKISTDLS